MAEIQLFYIGTSKIKEIRQGGSVTYVWGNKSGWIKFKKPGTSSKEIKYKKTYKSGDDKASNATSWRNGGVTLYGTSIPATAQRMIAGVSRTCNVRFRMRKYFKYTRTSKQKKKGKCTKKTYTYYKYQLQYADKAVVTTKYSSYKDGTDYIFFSDHYYNSSGVKTNTTGHLPHPAECSLTYSDVRRNFESNANNADSRDNKGTYVLSNVRANVATLQFTWKGLTAEEGQDLIDSLNPDKAHPYLVVQYLNHSTGKYRNGTFFASDRVSIKYPNGMFKEITVTLTEV